MSTTISGTNGVSQCDTDSVSTNDIQNAAITAAKLSGAQTGSAPIYGCRAWCVFDGTLTGTNAPTAGGNVTSVTRNGAGDYTVNISTALPSTPAMLVSLQSVAAGAAIATGKTATPPTTTQGFVYTTTTGGSLSDSPRITVLFFC